MKRDTEQTQKAQLTSATVPTDVVEAQLRAALEAGWDYHLMSQYDEYDHYRQLMPTWPG